MNIAELVSVFIYKRHHFW